MVAIVGREAYREQLLALLPQGRAWPREPDSLLSLLMDAQAEEYARLDAVATGLLDEMLPGSTTALISDWEEDVGLPDECTDLATTILKRRAAILEKEAGRTNLNAASFIEVGANFGLIITVDEHDQVRADAIANLDTSSGKWRYVFWVNIPTDSPTREFDMLSHVDTPLLVEGERNVELECRLRKLTPSHTHMVPVYA